MNLVLPARARQIIYFALMLAGLAIGAVAAGFGPNTPHWYDIATRIFGFVVAAPATLALLNVNRVAPLPKLPAGGPDAGRSGDQNVDEPEPDVVSPMHNPEPDTTEGN